MKLKDVTNNFVGLASVVVVYMSQLHRRELYETVAVVMLLGQQEKQEETSEMH